MQDQHAPKLDDVTIAAAGDEWNVTIRQAGRSAVIHFLLERHARSFAESQSRRLGITTGAGRRTLEGEAGIIATSRM